MVETARMAANMVKRDLGIKEERSWETIFSTEGMPIPFDDGVLDFGAGAEVPFDKIANGSTCKVVWDSVAYICAAKVGSNGIDIGDIDGNDGSIPFYIHAVKHSDEWSVSIWADTPEPSHIIDLYLQTETITPIDPKHLPGPVVIDFDKLGIGEAFNELIGKGGGSTTVNLPADFWEGLPINRPIMIRTEIIAFGYSMTAPATVFHETDGTFVLTVSAKEIINGSLVTVGLSRVTSSISVQMISLA